MSTTVCLCANTLYYPRGGGHLWVYLNWALGLCSLGCRVIWLEQVVPSTPPSEVQRLVASLKNRLDHYGLAGQLALSSSTNEPLAPEATAGYLDLEVAVEADLLLNLQYHMPSEVVKRFPRSALVDIDPGLTQIWISEGQINLAPHDLYFTIGETVGQPEAPFPDCGVRWEYTPPPVFLPAWPPTRVGATSRFSTVTHWWGPGVEFRGERYGNGKREGFVPFLDLPRRTTQPLELAIYLGREDEEREEWIMAERTALAERGWRVRPAHTVASTPWHYQSYIQDSRGEFSCAKPSCIRLQNAWISDRTLCYLATGKPAVVQHTGPSRFLPDAAGLFRFHDIDEAVRSLQRVADDYEEQCRLARALAEEYFDARKVVGRVLEQGLT